MLRLPCMPTVISPTQGGLQKVVHPPALAGTAGAPVSTGLPSAFHRGRPPSSTETLSWPGKSPPSQCCCCGELEMAQGRVAAATGVAPKARNVHHARAAEKSPLPS